MLLGATSRFTTPESTLLFLGVPGTTQPVSFQGFGFRVWGLGFEVWGLGFGA